MANSKKFQTWHKMECARRLGQLESIEDTLDEQMKELNIKVEYYNPK